MFLLDLCGGSVSGHKDACITQFTVCRCCIRSFMLMVHLVYASSKAFLKRPSLFTGCIENSVSLFASFLKPCYIAHYVFTINSTVL